MKMITLCTVTTKHIDNYVNLLLQNIQKKLKNVSEVVVASNDFPATLYGSDGVIRTWHPLKENRKGSWGHAYGLHECLKFASGKYILFCDPDILFYTCVDEIYLELMNKHSLDLIGISYDNPTIMSFTFFPFIQNLLVKRDWLPPTNYLNGKKRRFHLKVEDMSKLEVVENDYLAPGPIEETWKNYPNTDGSYDTSCNLWQWCQEKKGRWMSFQSLNGFDYITSSYRTNFKLKEKLPNQKLLYHLTGCSRKMDFFSNYQNLAKKINAQN